MEECFCGFTKVVEQLADVIIRFDRATQLLYANASIRRLGLEPAEVVGKTWEQLKLPSEVRHLWKGYLEAVFKTGEQVTFETGVSVCNKEQGYFCINLLPEFDAGGKVESVLCIARDVTEIKKFAQNLSEQAAKEKRLEQEIARLAGLNLVGKLAAGIGHEIRNSLTTVRGFLQLLNAKEHDDKSKECFHIMIEELDRSNAIISEYLAVAKNKPTEFKKASLNHVIEALYPLLQGAAFQSNKKLSCVLDDVGQAMFDENEIRQLILNLVKNGLEAASVNGCVSLKTFMDGDQIVLQIQDDGPGMAAQVLEKIGTPFFTTKESGTGLGLAVCYSIAKRHQAKIDVQSSSAGTIFNVCFPALS